LPKPRNGVHAANPILSEDVYNQKVRKPRKKAKEIEDDTDGVVFGGVKKHVAQPSHVAEGLAHLTTNARNNPNERKNMPRANRRR
jgi:hypothetical protein